MNKQTLHERPEATSGGSALEGEASPDVNHPLEAKASSSTAKANILIVDDTTANLRLLSNMLTVQAYKVRAVVNGPMALTAVRTAPPDLILLDINMPGMSGYEVCAQLKADPQTRDIPVIFISALDEIRDKVKAFTVGGVDYITKPFQLEEVLARVQTHLALQELRRQLQEAHDRLKSELTLAGKIQASFLSADPPDIAGWQFATLLKSAKETSGDFYDVSLLPNGHVGILVADVVDKGIGAALYMALSWTLMRTYANEYPTQPDLVLKAVNRRILVDTETNLFVTVFYGILDPATGTFVYANAGHNPPYVFRSSKYESDAVIEKLTRTGVPLGLFQDKTWESDSIQIAPGEVLVLYTDGVTEAQNIQGVCFGEDRLMASLKASLGGVSDMDISARDIQAAVTEAVCEFVGDAPQFDDFTLVTVVRGV